MGTHAFLALQMILAQTLGQKAFKEMFAEEVRQLKSASNAAIAKAAGNGMHLPSAGFACFIAMLRLTPTPDWKS